MSTFIISAVLMVMFILAIRYLVKNGACAGCSSKSDGVDCKGTCSSCAKHAQCCSLNDRSQLNKFAEAKKE